MKKQSEKDDKFKLCAGVQKVEAGESKVEFKINLGYIVRPFLIFYLFIFNISPQKIVVKKEARCDDICP